MDSSLLVESFGLSEFINASFLLAAETSRLASLGNTLWVTFQVAAGLGFVIFVHELGHFLAAKTFGVRCDKFYVGFDVPITLGPLKFPRALAKYQWGETEYGIGIIPLGGYVKMLGQDDDPRRAEEEANRVRLGEGEDAPLDPRSYPAKPVWQRMIIISAGVVMNLIFAVILAAVAYRFGVPYTPTVVGTTYGGGPAWAAGLEHGDQVLRAGYMKEDSEELRYNDFATAVATYGFENGSGALPIVVKKPDGTRTTLTAHPTPKYHPDGFFFIGVNPPLTPVIGTPAYREESFVAQSKPDLKINDSIVAVNGTPLPIDGRFGKILGSDFTAELQANWEEDVTVTLERTDEEKQTSTEIEVKLPAVPVRTMGLGFEVGPIAWVSAGSPGEKAGLRVGDVITAVNGQPVTNGLELPSMVARLSGETVQLSVLRGSAIDNDAGTESENASGQTVELTLENAARASFDWIAPRAGELTLGGVGVAFNASPRIQSIDESMTGSDKDVKVGDELVEVHWMAPKEKHKEIAKLYPKDWLEPMQIGNAFTIANLYAMLQTIPVDAEVRCVFQRDGKVRDPVLLKSQYASDWFWHQRGVMLTPMSQIHQTDNIATAAQLGLWETSRRFKEVLNVLRLLFTGRLGLKGLGGPGQIAYVAAAEANRGVSRLLLFLTFLSANLAILNFLPIPALDGGHMVFLTAEAIRGKPVNEELQVRLTMVGVLCLLSLMAFVIIKDILWFAN